MTARYRKVHFVMSFVGMLILIYLSLSAAFLVLLIGLLLIPSVMVFVFLIKEGVPIFTNELRRMAFQGKDFFVISISQESISLEPQFR